MPRYSAIATCTKVPRSAPRGFWPMRNDPMITAIALCASLYNSAIATCTWPMRNDPMIHAQRSNDPSLTSRLPNSLGVQLRRFALWQQGRNALKPSDLSGFCSTHVNDWRNGDRSVATGKKRIGSHQSLWFSAALTSMIGATVTAVKAQHCTEPPLDPQCARVIPATAGVCPPSCRKLPPPGGSRHRT